MDEQTREQRDLGTEDTPPAGTIGVPEPDVVEPDDDDGRDTTPPNPEPPREIGTSTP